MIIFFKELLSRISNHNRVGLSQVLRVTKQFQFRLVWLCQVLAVLCPYYLRLGPDWGRRIVNIYPPCWTILIEQSNNARCAFRTVIAQMAHCSDLLSKPVLNFYYFEKIHINPNILDYLSFRTCDKCTCILKLLVLRREIVLIFSVGKMVWFKQDSRYWARILTHQKIAVNHSLCD